MREVGVDSPFASFDAGYGAGHVTIYANCERRLFDIELDLGNSGCTFEAVQWAISELQRMELQERSFGSGDDEGEADGGSLVGSSGEGPRLIAGGKRLQRTELGGGKQDPGDTTWTGIQSGRESLEEKLVKRRIDKDASPGGPVHHVEEPAKVNVKNWRHIFKATSGGKRKPDEEASGNEGEKKAKVEELFSMSTSKEAVTEADHGEAGKRMAERITSRLAIPEYIYLTNLVSHALLVSMDQVPTRSIQIAVASVGLNSPGAGDWNKGNGSEPLVDRQGENSWDGGEWMWLHKWLVRTVLSDAGDDSPFASLDWLIAFITATRQSLIKPILDDLASDLLKRENEVSSTLASYVRRTGVLEYAALRDPERTFGSLRPLFPPASFPTRGSEGDEARRHGGGNEVWHGWLVLMVLCPRLFGAFSRLCIPTLSVDVLKSWSIKFTTTSLPAIWTLLLDNCIEEPRTTREWLFSAIMRRLPELAPVASDFVVLLSEVDETSTGEGTNRVGVGCGKYILASLYKELSKHVLPKVLGKGQEFRTDGLSDADNSGEDSGIALFMENLKQRSHVLWRKALERYSTSKCTCCEIPRKDELQLESSGRTEAGNDGSMLAESSEDGSDLKSRHEQDIELQRGCLYRDPLIQLCHLSLLCCTEHVVADLLASASLVRPCPMGSFEDQSLRRLLMVMRVMRIVSGQGRGTLILDLWAQQMTDHATIASDEQALQRILAMKQLLDSTFWHNYHILLGSSSQFKSTIPIVASEDVAGHQGLSWKLEWKVLHKVLDVRWLHILPLMHRDGAWELRLAVLGVLQLLNSDGNTRPQAVADRLKGVLGLFFSWLEMYDGCDDQSVLGQAGITAPTLKSRWRWQCARALEHLKSIIVELASSSFPSFTLMINSLLDFSFEHSKQKSFRPSPSSSTSPLSRTELAAFPFQRAGSASHSSFCVAPLSTGKLDRYGKLVLKSGPSSDLRSSSEPLQIADNPLTEENCKIQTGASPSLNLSEKERMAGFSRQKHVGGQNAASSTLIPDHFDKAFLMRSKVLDAELGNLLHRTLERAISKSVELLDAWPCHPVNVLATHLADRLETPHEVPMTMEQYEEILPKHISSLRHIFLTDCFSQNPLLMEMVELIVKHGGNRAVLRCVEFVRVLLADSISRWHGVYRTRWPHSLPQAKVNEEETWNRLQVSRLIQLVASANWLPQPLAASGEIVAVIDGADIADLLLLAWRCMHHAMAFGPKAWGESSSSLLVTGGLLEGQAISTTGSGAEEEAGKEGTYTEWEGHFFAILRRNVSKIGAHFAQVYPIRKTL